MKRKEKKNTKLRNEFMFVFVNAFILLVSLVLNDAIALGSQYQKNQSLSPGQNGMGFLCIFPLIKLGKINFFSQDYWKGEAYR